MTDKAASSHRLPAVFGSFTKGKRKDENTMDVKRHARQDGLWRTN